MNWVVESNESRVRLGGILSRIGWVWAMLFAVANFAPSTGTPFDEILAFFGGTLWLPFMMVFAGRALKRGAATATDGESGDKKSEQAAKPPLILGQTPPPPPLPPPVQARPQPKARPKPQPAPEPRFEPEPLLEDPIDPEPSFDPALFEMPDTPTYTGKTSAEMIEEAKKRLSDR